uniref:Uncharacterized protein n=2 Tax=Oryza sativa subsp. japonica TaxID=39947 RepID=Q7G482_ORYSJ|nr:hypothetical protein [Oryza sativa Japonica Group]AAP52699.1 hypothetical protein LOC_Os10g13540 [Oryza sativa Japonica Group]
MAEIDSIYHVAVADRMLTSAMTTPPAAARDLMVAGDLGHGGAIRGHYRDEGNSPVHDTTTDGDSGEVKAAARLGLMAAAALQ